MAPLNVGFVKGGLLDGAPREYLHRAGKLTPSPVSYLLGERDKITSHTTHCAHTTYLNIDTVEMK